MYRPRAFTVIAGKIGRLEPFDNAIESWDSYHERPEQYFICNEVKAERKYPFYYVDWWKHLFTAARTYETKENCRDNVW